MSNTLVFFDGVCNLCNGLVSFLLKIDHKHKLRFATLQGATARQMLADEAQSLSSLIVIHKGEVYRQSRAVLRIALSLGGIWILLASPLFIIPNLLRDRMYAVVARHRYKLVGKSQICRVPTAKEAKLFLP